MEDFDTFLGRDLRLFGVDQAFIDSLKWMDKFVAEEVEVWRSRRRATSIAHPVPANDACGHSMRRLLRKVVCRLGISCWSHLIGPHTVRRVCLFCQRRRKPMDHFGFSACVASLCVDALPQASAPAV